MAKKEARASPMLTGRESLIRLIGKRRRVLPNRQSLFPAIPEEIPSLSHSQIHHLPKEENATQIDSKAPHKAGGDQVTCPVCGDAVHGSDYTLNSHLDLCLVRGTKRKLKQRTLLQFNFCSNSLSKDNINLRQQEADELLTLPDDNNTINNKNDSSLPEFDAVGGNSPPSSRLGSETREELSVEKLISNKEVDTSSEVDTGNSIDDTSMRILNTFIVGRKFSEADLNQGDEISLLRDPHNVKDPNAIKVVSMDSKCPKVLGFLPRELARCLSPLIHKYNLIFQGNVMSLPKHSLDIVPVEMVCQEIASYGENESYGHEAFESAWRNVLSVVEYAKTFPPSMTKYQQNFNLLIQEVMKNHHQLFTDDERLFIDSFSLLSEDSQRLFIRLYTRKGPWFRMSCISYPEIFDCQQAIEGLCALGYICSLESTQEHDYELKEVLDVLYVSELREILSRIHQKKRMHSARRQELMASLLASYEDGMCSPLLRMVINQTGTCIRISPTVEFLLWRVQRLFFLNGEQDLSAFLMVDMGLVKYPSYNCIISNKIFSSRCNLLAYEKAIEVAQVMDESLDENNNETVIKCIDISTGWISSPSGEVTQSSIPDSIGLFPSLLSASSVYSKVASLGISFLERERRYEDAIKLLQLLLRRITCDGRRGYWTLRLSIDLEHIGRLDESLSVAEESLRDPWVRAGSKMALQRRILRLGKPPRRWRTPTFSDSVKRKIKEVHVIGRPLNCDLGMKNRFYGDDGEQCGVEQLALQYYAGEGGGWQGVHTESGIWMTIFGLLMWDVIFTDVPDVFHTKFQTAPLDLGTDHFYIARKNLIESQLDKIRGGMAEEIVICSWESHVGTSCRGVNWDRHSLSDLRAAVTCVGGPCLASLCRLLAEDYRSWSSGMPDLFLWRFVGEYTGEAKLVEVKGPRDRLSEQQRAWLLLLMDCGFDAEVCKVSPASQSM